MSLHSAEQVRALEAQLDGLEGDEARAPLLRDLRYWHTRQTTAQIAPPPEYGVAAIGSRVRFRMGGRDRVIDIVGHDEADPAAGRISFSAPLARALLGAEAGDWLAFAGQEDAIEVLAIVVVPGRTSA